MATTIRELLVAIGVKADAKALTAFDSRLTTAKANLSDLGRWAKWATAGVVALGVGLGKVALDAGAYGDSVAKAGKRVGDTAENVQRLTYAAKIAGGSWEDLETGLKKVSRGAYDASSGLKEAKDAFKGIEYTTATGALKTPTELFLSAADALSKMTNESERTARAQELFGRSGTMLLPMIMEGKSGIAALMREADALGLVMSDKDAAAAEEFTDSMERVGSVMTGIRNQIGSALFPELTRLLGLFKDWMLTNRDWLRQRIDLGVASIVRQLERMLAFGKRVNEFVENKVGGWGRVFAGVGAAAGAGVLVKVLVTLNSLVQLAIASWPILVAVVGGISATMVWWAVVVAGVLLGLAALYLAVDDVVVMFREGDSVLGRFLDRFVGADRRIQITRDLLEALARAGDAASAMWTAMGRVLDATLIPILRALQPLLDALGISFDGYLGKKAEEILQFFRGLTIVLDAMASVLERSASGWERIGRVGVVGAISTGGLAKTITPAAAGGPIDRSRTVQQSNTFHVTSSTPEDAARQISQELERQHRKARAAFGGGEL